MSEVEYYEAHITVEPVFDSKREILAGLSKQYCFRLAELLMKKNREDTLTRSDKDSFLTGTNKDYNILLLRMVALIGLLKREKYKVYRYKIEKVVLDSKTGDSLGIL